MIWKLPFTFKTILLLCLFRFDKVSSVVFVDEFFDHADVYCGNKLNIPTEVYKSWYNTDMEIVDEKNPVSEEFISCWMHKRGLTNENGDLINDVLMEWLQNDVYMYVRKDDAEKYPIEGRKAAVASISNECKKTYGLDNNVKGHVLRLYNCVILRISKL